ncbi:hypothetical protein FBY35_0037 [Streptomyces sp. SLBN-118]|nr:hypothetical protein FBY35_0037 [Streptomyces sp. SLBN-118]
MRALRIDRDATVTDINLPEPDAQSAIRELVGSPDAVDQGAYHRRAAPAHPRQRSASRAPAEPGRMGPCECLARHDPCTHWAGPSLSPAAGDRGRVATLEDNLVQHTKAVAQTVRTR